MTSPHITLREKKMKSGLMLGVNPDAIRQQEDFYATNPTAINLFWINYNKME